MHELGVVVRVIEIVEQAARENGLTEVASITLEVGEVSTVIPEYLVDAWQWYRKKTELLQETELKIETLPAVTLCENCGREYPTVQFAKQCPDCGSLSTHLLRGNEFAVKEIEGG